MCGIVGLLLKDPSLRPRLGEFMVPMLVGMTERGPDSSGMAVFSDCGGGGTAQAQPVLRRSRLRLAPPASARCWSSWAMRPSRRRPITASSRRALTRRRCASWLAREYPAVHVLSVGRSIDLYKDLGLPAEVADRYGFARMSGTHLVGHTRMATESAVTPENAHPYTAGRGLVPGAQRLARQSRQPAAQAREAR